MLKNDIESTLFTFDELPDNYKNKVLEIIKNDTELYLKSLGYTIEEMNCTKKTNTSLLDYEANWKIDKLYFGKNLTNEFYIIKLDKIRL